MARISEEDLSGVYEFAVQLAKDAGRLLLDGAKSRIGDNGKTTLEAVEKDSSVDVVTQIDEGKRLGGYYVEAFVKKSILLKYPAHRFLGEETYSKGATREYLVDDSPTWVVDPLDGTVNYTHIFPMFCISIGFVVNGEPTIGVIYAPMLDQLFSSCLGRGAWLNETTRLPLLRNPIASMPESAPKGCIFSCEWGKDRRDTPDGNMSRKVESFVNMACELGGRGGKGGMVHGVRSLGSAALDLAYIAMGSFDIWWEGGCWEWDVAAGFAIVREAGGIITTANPPTSPETAVVEEAALGGRLYLAIRPAGPSSTETGRQSQERTVREVWKRVAALDYSRP